MAQTQKLAAILAADIVRKLAGGKPISESRAFARAITS